MAMLHPAPEASDQPAATVPELACLPAPAAIRTFIVEDSAVILDNLVATLEEMTPVQVVGNAADESTAVKRLVQMRGELDLVIIDVLLKAGSGLGVLRHMAETGMRAKRIVLTNYASAELRERCRELGADRIFDKSTDLDSLLSYCSRFSGRAPGLPG